MSVVGTDLVGTDTVVAMSGRNARELAATFGLEPGAAAEVYHDGSGVGPDETLVLDPSVQRDIAHAHELGDAALRRLAPGVEPILWPEHFDIGITLENVGAIDSFETGAVAQSGPVTTAL